MRFREFLCVGDKLLFREGRTKGLGIVTATGFDRLKFPHALIDDVEETPAPAGGKPGTGVAAGRADKKTAAAAAGGHAHGYGPATKRDGGVGKK